VYARENGHYRALLWLAYLVLALALGGILAIAVPLVRRAEVRAAEQRVRKGRFPRPEGDYVARYSTQDQVIAIILTIFWGNLTLFMLVRSGKLPLQIALVALFCGLIAYTLRVTSTKVRFTNEGINRTPASVPHDL